MIDKRRKIFTCFLNIITFDIQLHSVLKFVGWLTTLWSYLVIYIRMFRFVFGFHFTISFFLLLSLLHSYFLFLFSPSITWEWNCTMFLYDVIWLQVIWLQVIWLAHITSKVRWIWQLCIISKPSTVIQDSWRLTIIWWVLIYARLLN